MPVLRGLRGGRCCASSVAAAIRMVILHPGTARQYAPVIFGMGLCGCFGEMAADGFRAAFMLFRELCGGLFAVADINDQAPFCLNCFEPQKRHFLHSRVLSSWEPYSARATKIFSMSFVRHPEEKLFGIKSLCGSSDFLRRRSHGCACRLPLASNAVMVGFLGQR